MCETKSATTALYLDMNEDLPDVSKYEKEIENLKKKDPRPDIGDLQRQVDMGHDYVFIGKVGQFCPIKPGFGGGILLRESTDRKTGEKKYDAVGGSKGYRWLESEMVKQLGKQDAIDRGYYDAMVDEAVRDISALGDFEWFVSDDPYAPDDTPPWFGAGEPHADETTPFDVR